MSKTQTEISASALGRIARRIATVRGKKSQRACAKALGVYQQNVNRYENGQVPHLSFLFILAKKTGVNLHWLLTGHGETVEDQFAWQKWHAETPVDGRRKTR